MYILENTFRNCVISRHRTLEAAIRAQRRHLSSVRRANGPNSYMTYEITLDGKRIDDDAWFEAIDAVDRGY